MEGRGDPCKRTIRVSARYPQDVTPRLKTLTQDGLKTWPKDHKEHGPVEMDNHAYEELWAGKSLQL